MRKVPGAKAAHAEEEVDDLAGLELELGRHEEAIEEDALAVEARLPGGDVAVPAGGAAATSSATGPREAMRTSAPPVMLSSPTTVPTFTWRISIMRASNPASEMRYFRQKVDAGANGAITQYFFNADAYFRFCEDAAKLGVSVPITPGIMPITNHKQLARFSAMCGAEIPSWISRRLQAWSDDVASIREFGADVVAGMSRRLLEGGAPGLHFYTLNRAQATLRILDRLL